eukprot:CAMPEP_0198352206 /NCGR_PEP_ID=MMETSP1450-20131203/106195_1 /TAXON_ID=753684 ORGANISM="Madagascaria erythrocladiodes, Strain CCMP3234" /NCGR_SAMPLE_ID=MMETSP1450 /ASSEMBLY_ACC=CAM_ASM_001115 /LENGTH=74 /DNA_ID=CAMNT_0044058219 /DNA_START=63 /DNA_END=283 /DNA_ORIENTATION=+
MGAMSLLLVALLLAVGARGARFAFVPHPGADSHVMAFQRFARVLLRRGHEVSMTRADMDAAVGDYAGMATLDFS